MLSVVFVVTAPMPVPGQVHDPSTDAAVKAAFLFNFAKFAERPALPARATLITCVVGNDGVAELSVSDATGFARTGGIIEFYVDSGRMRFAINVDAAQRSGLRLSSRLLGLATIILGTESAAALTFADAPAATETLRPGAQHAHPHRPALHT